MTTPSTNASPAAPSSQPCPCGHPAADHNADGCMHPHDDGSFRFCPCRETSDSAVGLVLCEFREPPREPLAEYRRRFFVKQLLKTEAEERRAAADARDEGLLENFCLVSA